MKATYLIKKAGKSDVKTIYIQFYERGKRIVFATRFSINQNDWAGGFPKPTNKTFQLRKDLLDYQEEAKKLIDQTISAEQRTPSKAELQQLVDRLNGGNEKEYIDDYFDRYIKTKSKELKPSTLKITKKAKSLLHDFNPKMEFTDFNAGFSESFQQFLLDRGTQNVTANNYIRKVKSFLKWCFDMEIINVDLGGKYIKLLKEIEKPIFVVEEDELAAIEHGYNYNTGKPVELIPRLQRIKDLFLFGCYTGLRFDDLQSLTDAIVQDDKIVIMTEKTYEPLTIPLLPEAKAIWNRYDGQLHQISNMKANDYLKELFKLHGLTRTILEIEQTGNKVEKLYTPLCEAITFHKSRKTFIVNALKAGIPTKMVMKLSGHKQDRTFNKYISFADTVLENEMKKMSRSARTLRVERAG